jgi:hypothetical protein
MNNSILIIPDDALYEILLYLERSDIYNIGLSSKEFHRLCSNNILWRRLLFRDTYHKGLKSRDLNGFFGKLINSGQWNIVYREVYKISQLCNEKKYILWANDTVDMIDDDIFNRDQVDYMIGRKRGKNRRKIIMLSKLFPYKPKPSNIRLTLFSEQEKYLHFDSTSEFFDSQHVSYEDFAFELNICMN